ncbi:MAG: sugar phosphate isomerase/epimerase, partial [Planctomycetes bacterium]|nr:sugar phosphate isomerase/epimerase [Planctomycetota bacterium]
GFEYIEPEVMTGRCLLNIHGYCNITSLEDDPMDMRKMIEKAGLKVACLSAHTNLINTEYGADYLRKAIRFAYILGAPIVNTAEGVKPDDMPDDVAFNIIKYNLETLLKTAENYDIKITIEPHGIYTTNAEGLLKIMSLTDSPYLGINFDTGNTTIAGNDAVETLKTVLDHVIHCHVKDIKRAEVDSSHETGVTAGCAIGDGEVDIKGCLDLLKSKNYDGALAIECHSSEALKKSKAYLDPLIA